VFGERDGFMRHNEEEEEKEKEKEKRREML
jgi:hypothetical protein